MTYFDHSNACQRHNWIEQARTRVWTGQRKIGHEPDKPILVRQFCPTCGTVRQQIIEPPKTP